MRKSYLFVLVLICVGSLLSGCSVSSNLAEAWSEGVAQGESMIASNAAFKNEFVNEYFQLVAEDSEYSFRIYRDVLTDVMYVSYTTSSAYGRGASFTVMYSDDGSPLLYSDWLELLEAWKEASGNG